MANVTNKGLTDMGRKRTNNEDAFIATPLWDGYQLAVAIDGVGGYEGGEIAAAIAQEGIVEYLKEHTEGDHLQLLRQAVIYVNNKIVQQHREDSTRSNMSCVLTAALFDVKNNQVHMAHVGDSRMYMYCNGQLDKLSHDHSLVGYQEEQGILSEEEAMHHPQRNLIMRSVGADIMNDDTDQVETQTFPIPRLDCAFLLCSDGLTDLVTSQQIIDVLENGSSVPAKLQQLVDDANDAGGKDNITVVIVEFKINEETSNVINEPISEELEPPAGKTQTGTSMPPVHTKKKTKLTKLAIPFFIVTVLLIASIVAGILMRNSMQADYEQLQHQHDSVKAQCDSIKQVVNTIENKVYSGETPDYIVRTIQNDVFLRPDTTAKQNNEPTAAKATASDGKTPNEEITKGH